MKAVAPLGARLVAVESDRRAEAIEIRSGRFEGVEGRLRLYEAQLHESARCIVHVDEQGAPGSPILEPLMIATVDLDPFADARSAMDWIVDAACPL